MVNPDMHFKIRWTIFAFLMGWALVFPSVSAGAKEYFSIKSTEKDFVFESNLLEEELLLTQNKNHPPLYRGRTLAKKKTQQTGLMREFKLDKNYFKGVFEDTGYLLESPLYWDRSDWAKFSLVAGLTGAVFAFDDEIKNEIQDSRNSSRDNLSDWFEPFGNGFITVPTMIGFYIYGRLAENKKVKRAALLATESFLVTGLFTTILKAASGRPRPDRGEQAGVFKIFNTSDKSFPSGHTSTAFAIATVLANEYENIPLVAPVSYGIATMTGLSRINDNKHWASDVVFGAALGYFTSKTILRLHNNQKGQHFTIYPRADFNGGGLVLSSRF